MRNLFFVLSLLLTTGLLGGCGVVRDIANDTCSGGSYNAAICPNILDRMVPKAPAVEKDSPKREIKCWVEVKTWRKANVVLQESTRTCKPEKAGVDQVLPGLALLLLLGFWLKGDEGLGYKAQMKKEAREGLKAIPWLLGWAALAALLGGLLLGVSGKEEAPKEEAPKEEAMCSEWRDGEEVTAPCWVLRQRGR